MVDLTTALFGSSDSESRSSSVTVSVHTMGRILCLLCLALFPHVVYAEVGAERTGRQEAIDLGAITPEGLALCARGDNPALSIAAAELEKAMSQLTLAKRSLFPSLSFDSLIAPLPRRRLLNYCVSETSSLSGLSQVVPCPNQDVQDDARISDVDGMGVFVRTSATLTQPLYTFGKIRHGREAAEAGVSAYRALTQVAQRRFDQLAFQMYYGLAVTKRAQRVFRKGRRHLKKLRKQIERELVAESGKYTSNDLRKLGIKESELGVASADVESQRRRAIQGIMISCKVPQSSEELTLKSSKLKPLKVTLEGQEEYNNRAFAQRPELIAAQHQVMAREAQRALALSNFFPDIALVGTFGFARGTSADDNPDPFANDPFNVLGYGAYLGLRWRLNVAQLTSKLQASEAAISKARAELEGLKMQIKLELGEQYIEVVRRRETLAFRESAQKQAKQWVTSTMMSRSVGLVSVKEGLDAITAYFTSALHYDREVYEYNLALTRLWSLSGDDPLKMIKESTP